MCHVQAHFDSGDPGQNDTGDPGQDDNVFHFPPRSLMSMIRKRSHSNTNVSKKEKPPQQESGMAHPFSGCVGDPLGLQERSWG